MASEIMRLWMPDPLDGLAGPLPADEDLLPASRDEALVRAASIREGIERFAREVVPQVARAYLCRDWVVLGYPSWEAYVRAEFGTALVKLSRPERQDAVGTLRLFGMSTRAIASSLGVDPKTIRNDLRDVAGSGGENSPPDGVVGADGKQYAASRPADIIDAQVVEPTPVPSVVPAPVEPEPVPLTPALVEPAPAAAVDEGTELVAGPVRIRVRAQRRPGGVPAVFVRLVRSDRTIGEEWIEADSNDDPLECGAALDEADLDDLINTLIDAKAQLRRLAGAA